MNVMKIFKDSGALLEGHFLLHSGRHSNKFLQCAQALQYPKYAEQLCKALAEKCAEFTPETVIGPAVGGIIIAYEVAKFLDARAIFTEKREGVLAMGRGFGLRKGERVLVVDDVSTTGDSVNQTIKVAENYGGKVVGVGLLVDRSGGTIKYPVPDRNLLVMKMESWEKEKCPLCKKNIPLIDPDTRKPVE